MITAQKSWWADQLFGWYLFWTLRRHFSRLSLFGELPDLSRDLPVILTPNHSTWWDGFFVYLLNKKLLDRDLYLMMTEEQLSRFPFFRRVGAYSIKPVAPRSVMQSLEYTVSLMENGQSGKPRLICVFPQGSLEPWSRRPLEYRRGLEWVFYNAGGSAVVLPLAIKATVYREQRPEAFFLFGEAVEVTGQSFPAIDRLESQEEKLLAQLQESLEVGEQTRDIFTGKRSIHDQWMRIRQKSGDSK